MSAETGPRVTVAIGVLAIFLTAISPAITWAAEPVKQEKTCEKTGAGTHERARPKSDRYEIRYARDHGKVYRLFR